MPQVRPDRVRRNEQLGGDLRCLQVRGKEAEHAELGLAELFEVPGRRSVGRHGTGQHVEDDLPERGMCGAVSRQAFEQWLYGNEDERQEDALRLGEVECLLERGLRRTL